MHSICFLSDIDLSSPLTSDHLSTYRPTALLLISVIDRFQCEHQPASCIRSMMNHFKIEKIFGRGDTSSVVVQESNAVENPPKGVLARGRQHLAPLIVNDKLYYEHLFDLCLALPFFCVFLSFCLYSLSLFLFAAVSSQDC